jgi:hypothetical protein
MSIQYTPVPLSELGDDEMIAYDQTVCKVSIARKYLPPHVMVELVTGLQEAYDRFVKIEKKLINESMEDTNDQDK